MSMSTRVVSLSICLSICLSLYQSVYQSVCQSVYQSVSLSISQSASQSVSQYACIPNGEQCLPCGCTVYCLCDYVISTVRRKNNNKIE